MDAATTRALDAMRLSFQTGDFTALNELLTPSVVLDWRLSDAPDRGFYEGPDSFAAFFASRAQAFTSRELHWSDPFEIGSRMALFGETLQRGQASGAAVRAGTGMGIELEGGRVSILKVFRTLDESRRWVRLGRLGDARLYFVCEGVPGVEGILDAALRGGVDVIQLREKAPRCAEELVSLAEPFRRLADSHGALFVLNDRPDLVAATGADGVHVGQDDTPVAAARAEAGEGVLVGLSSHAPDQLAGAEGASGLARPDYVSVGPVWETPTKPGRPAAGLEYVRNAAATATLPWFAIGGIDESNVGDVAAAGAQRAVVVRAIRDADEPEAVARALRAALTAASADSPTLTARSS